METRHLRGLLIRRLREERLWTRDRLSKEAGVSPMTVTNAEEGRTEIRLRQIEAFARALDIDPHLLLHPEEAIVPKEDPLLKPLKEAWFEERSDASIFTPTGEWAEVVLSRAREEGLEALDEEAARLRRDRDRALEDLKGFSAAMFKALGGSRKDHDELLRRLDRIRRGLRSDVRRAYQTRLMLLGLIDEEIVGQEVELAVEMLMRAEADRLGTVEDVETNATF